MKELKKDITIRITRRNKNKYDNSYCYPEYHDRVFLELWCSKPKCAFEISKTYNTELGIKETCKTKEETVVVDVQKARGEEGYILNSCRVLEGIGFLDVTQQNFIAKWVVQKGKGSSKRVEKEKETEKLIDYYSINIHNFVFCWLSSLKNRIVKNGKCIREIRTSDNLPEHDIQSLTKLIESGFLNDIFSWLTPEAKTKLKRGEIGLIKKEKKENNTSSDFFKQDIFSHLTSIIFFIGFALENNMCSKIDIDPSKFKELASDSGFSEKDRNQLQEKIVDKINKTPKEEIERIVKPAYQIILKYTGLNQNEYAWLMLFRYGIDGYFLMKQDVNYKKILETFKVR